VVEMALPKLLLIPSSRVEMAEMMEILSDEVVTLKRSHHNNTPLQKFKTLKKKEKTTDPITFVSSSLNTNSREKITITK